MKRIPIVNTIIERDGRVLTLKRNFEPKNKIDLLGGDPRVAGSAQIIYNLKELINETEK